MNRNRLNSCCACPTRNFKWSTPCRHSHILTTTTATESLAVTTHTISCLTNTSQDAMLTRMLEPSARARRECMLHVYAHTNACTHSLGCSGIILCVQLLIQLLSLDISRYCTHACSCSEVMFCVLRYALLIIKTRAIHSYLAPVYSRLCCVCSQHNRSVTTRQS